MARRAFYIAATRHQAGFFALYNADPNKLPFSSLSVPLRMGSATPDWRSPSAQDLSASWKDMQVPGSWESRGLTDFDGIVWFTRTVDVPQDALVDTLSLGPVRNTARVWVNGIQLNGSAPAAPPVAANIAAVARASTLTFDVAKGVVKPGANTITVQVTNQRAEGGFIGTAAEMYLKAGERRLPLAGTWKYRVERSSNTGTLYARPGELAAHVAFVAGGGTAGAAGAALPVVASVPDVVIQLSVVPNEMKYATTEITVQPGQLVEIVLSNPDQMPHNFVLGATGSLQAIGAAADQFAQTAGAAGQDYAPDMAQILFKARMVGPGESVAFQFRAPTTPGAYPYLCTYPNHWRIMNGVLNVAAGGRGFGPGRGALPTATPEPGSTGRGRY